MADWLANSSIPWYAYWSLMACWLVAMYNHPQVHPVGIRKTLRRTLVKISLCAAGDQAKVVCENLRI